MKRSGLYSLLALAGLATALVLGSASACAPKTQENDSRTDVAAAAKKVYVAPGELDEYYMFSSGGHSGQVYVYGLPSMRHISTIPVFTPYPATGYGFDDDSKKMLGGLFDVAALGVSSWLPSGAAARVLMSAAIINPIGAVRTGVMLALDGTAAFGAASLAFLRFTHGASGAALWLATSVVLWVITPFAVAAYRLKRADL